MASFAAQSDKQVVRKIAESLLLPAANILTHLRILRTKVQLSLNVQDSDTDEKGMAAATAEDNPNVVTQMMKKQTAQCQAKLATLKASVEEYLTKASTRPSSQGNLSQKKNCHNRMWEKQPETLAVVLL